MTKQYIGRIKPRGCSFKISFGYSTYCAMCICPSNCYGFSIGSMWTMMENWCSTHLNATFFRLCYCFPFFSCCKLLCRFLFWVRDKQPKMFISFHHLVASVFIPIHLCLGCAYVASLSFFLLLLLSITFHLQDLDNAHRNMYQIKFIRNSIIGAFVNFRWCCWIFIVLLNSTFVRKSNSNEATTVASFKLNESESTMEIIGGSPTLRQAKFVVSIAEREIVIHTLLFAHCRQASKIIEHQFLFFKTPFLT